jgi:hypothetical protein
MSPAPYNSTPTQDESEGDRLRGVYAGADQRYTWAVGEMTRQRETAKYDDFLKLANRVCVARAETAQALRALKLFESEHSE